MLTVPLPLQSPVLKTQTITISDVTNSLRGSVANKDVPSVHTATKTITYESAQVREPTVTVSSQASLPLKGFNDVLVQVHISSLPTPRPEMVALL